MVRLVVEVRTPVQSVEPTARYWRYAQIELVMSWPSGQLPPSPGMFRRSAAGTVPLPVASVLMSTVPRMMSAVPVPASTPLVFGGPFGQLPALVTKICMLPQALLELRPDEVHATVYWSLLLQDA